MIGKSFWDWENDPSTPPAAVYDAAGKRYMYCVRANVVEGWVVTIDRQTGLRQFHEVPAPLRIVPREAT